MKLPRKQRGMMLIMITFVVGLVATAYLLHAINPYALSAEREKVTSEALVEAKSALIGWSAKNSTPGQLPCPEDLSLIATPNEGSAMASCNNLNQRVGRLPWRTLGVGDIRDGNGDKLWYVISDGFRNAPININTIAQLTVDAVPNKAVAIIFSPGAPLQNQSRTAVANHTQYLDEKNGDGDAIFQTTGAKDAFNDRLILVSKVDLFNLITNRILGEIRGDNTQGLVSYYNVPSHMVYPYADINGNGTADLSALIGTPSNDGSVWSLSFPSNRTMLLNNGWFSLISYSLQPDRKSVTITLNGKSMLVTP